MWRAHPCVPRPHSWGRLFRPCNKCLQVRAQQPERPSHVLPENESEDGGFGQGLDPAIDTKTRRESLHHVRAVLLILTAKHFENVVVRYEFVGNPDSELLAVHQRIIERHLVIQMSESRRRKRSV